MWLLAYIGVYVYALQGHAMRYMGQISRSQQIDPSSPLGRPSSRLYAWMNVEEDDEDYEDIQSFKKIAQNYLLARYRDCREVGVTKSVVPLRPEADQ